MQEMKDGGKKQDVVNRSAPKTSIKYYFAELF